MPRYEYRCEKCNRVVELEQKINERCPPICTEQDCNIDMTPIISRTSFSLKGTGWAKDGYSSKG